IGRRLHHGRAALAPLRDRRRGGQEAREAASARGEAWPMKSEAREQYELIQWMQKRGLTFFAVPNSEVRGASEKERARRGARNTAQGVRAGIPDIIITSPVPGRPGVRCVGLELKREKGGRVSDAQKRWHARLAADGWVVRVCK